MIQTKIKKYKVSKGENLLRIDKYLSIIEKDYSRTYFDLLIKQGLVKVNSKIVSSSYLIREGDEIEVTYIQKEGDIIEPMKMKLNVVYEDDDLIVINKPQGLVVHPSNGHHNDTLVNALIYNNKELSKINGKYRVGIVHRIDKDTSGLLLICKNDFVHNDIAEQLKTHTMQREYYALVDGSIPNDYLKIVGKIGRDKKNRLKMALDNKDGKDAITHIEVIKRYDKYTFVKCRLETGRTHQIRVHLSSIRHPVVGDELYGGSLSIYNDGQLLHAYKLTFVHPKTKKNIVLEIDLPKYFKDVLEKLD